MDSTFRPHRNRNPTRLIAVINAYYPDVKAKPGKAARAVQHVRRDGVDWEGERAFLARVFGAALKRRHEYAKAWKHNAPANLMGLAEVAEYRGVSKQVISNWRKRGKLPEPLVQLAQGPIWSRETIVKHFAKD